jgi:hypothetical protein
MWGSVKLSPRRRGPALAARARSVDDRPRQEAADVQKVTSSRARSTITTCAVVASLVLISAQTPAHASVPAGATYVIDNGPAGSAITITGAQSLDYGTAPPSAVSLVLHNGQGMPDCTMEVANSSGAIVTREEVGGSIGYDPTTQGYTQPSLISLDLTPAPVTWTLNLVCSGGSYAVTAQSEAVPPSPTPPPVPSPTAPLWQPLPSPSPSPRPAALTSSAPKPAAPAPTKAPATSATHQSPPPAPHSIADVFPVVSPAALTPVATISPSPRIAMTAGPIATALATARALEAAEPSPSASAPRPSASPTHRTRTTLRAVGTGKPGGGVPWLAILVGLLLVAGVGYGARVGYRAMQANRQAI